MRKFTTIAFCLIATLFPRLLKAQMEFIENKGQWHNNVRYKGDFITGAFFLENKGFSVLLHNPEDLEKLASATHGHSHTDNEKKINTPSDGKIILNSFAYKVQFLGASSAAVQVGEKPLDNYSNYFIGSDPSKWASECKLYQAVTYKNIYPNIDLRYYSDATGKLKYDFIVKPGGNPAYIAMEYIGPKQITTKDKELIISTPVGDVRELSPYSYQSSTGKNVEVDCRYEVKENIVSFKVGKYDPSATLIIDPSIIFSSFTGSTVDNWGYTATPGADGSLYAGGIAFGTGYPVSPGSYQSTFGGGIDEGPNVGYDIAIFKFSSNGSRRLYATYLGGSGNEQPHSMIEDAQGNLIVAGRSNSPNYPNSNQIGTGGGYDIIITKLNATGTGVIGSVKIGGSGADGVNIEPKYPTGGSTSLRRNYGDDARSEVILDATGNIYLASCTQSTNFPILNAVQTSNNGGANNQDGVILKFNPTLSTNLFSTYFGGSGNDACFVANINPVDGTLYVAGATESANLPGDKTGVLGPTGAGIDGFVTQLRNDGSAILRTTYIGTSATDLVYGLKFDRAGFPYIMGTTTGVWPVLNATYSNAGSRQFIGKLQPNLSAYVYTTIFGGASSSPKISPIAFMVDRCENVYVSGWGGGLNQSQNYQPSNTFGMPEVSPLSGIPAADGADFYFFVLERNATSQLFGSHFGQNGGLGDHVDGGTSRFDENGVIYQAICANCGRHPGVIFPTTAGVWSSSNRSSNCNQAVVKIEMNFTGVASGVQASINSVKNDTRGCIPLYVQFSDTLRKGKKFYWNFGDGSPQIVTTVPDTAHTYLNVGTYLVRLISEDSSTCNIRDTSYVTIRAGNNRALLDFAYSKLPPCESLIMQFTNTSVATSGSFGPQSFVWDYGDGSPLDTAGISPPRLHTYASAGTYRVTLKIIDTVFCNTPDTVSKEIRINPLVKAQFETPGFGCAPYTAAFNNTSLAGTDFIWEFGDGNTSTDVHPTHIYNTPGTYNVRLIAIDLSTCNLRDTSAYFTIRVEAKPNASFTWSPNPPIANTPVQFTNTSTGAIVRYLWNFGDGESSTLTNPSHQYNETKTYNAELIAYTNAGCTDTFNLDVNVLIIPLLDVPNAFTPAQPGNNIIYVAGFGIGKMVWRIYNRQGLMVFQSNSPKQGWDGSYKGKIQSMDVYTYTLDAEFTDGKKVRKTGDITLLR